MRERHERDLTLRLDARKREPAILRVFYRLRIRHRAKRFQALHRKAVCHVVPRTRNDFVAFVRKVQAVYVLADKRLYAAL